MKTFARLLTLRSDFCFYWRRVEWVFGSLCFMIIGQHWTLDIANAWNLSQVAEKAAKGPKLETKFNEFAPKCFYKCHRPAWCFKTETRSRLGKNVVFMKFFYSFLWEERFLHNCFLACAWVGSTIGLRKTCSNVGNFYFFVFFGFFETLNGKAAYCIARRKYNRKSW